MTVLQIDNPLPDIISVHEAAEILKLSVSQTVRLANRGQFEAKLLGKQWAFRKASVEEYKKAREASKK